MTKENENLDTPQPDGSELSVEERIAAKFGGDEAEELSDDANLKADPSEEEGEEELETEDNSEEDELEASDENDGEAESLAEFLGIDDDRIVENEDGTLSFTTKVDGKTTAVPLKDVLDSYQLQEHVNNKSTKLGQEYKEFEAQKEKELGELTTKLSEAGVLVSYLEQGLIGDYQSVDWDSLRRDNPAEFTALKAEFDERAAGVERIRNDIKAKFGKISEARKQKMNASREEKIKATASEIMSSTDIKDDATLEKVMGENSEFLKTKYGFSDNDVTLIKSDARLFKLVQDAKSMHNAKRTAEDKKQRPVPKFRKNTSQRRAQTSKARAAKALKDRLRQTGSARDAAALLEDRM